MISAPTRKVELMYSASTHLTELMSYSTDHEKNLKTIELLLKDIKELWRTEQFLIAQRDGNYQWIGELLDVNMLEDL